MALHKKRLGDLLVETGIIMQDQLTEALVEQKRMKSKLGDTLLQLGYLTEQQLIEVLEFQLGIPHFSLSKYSIEPGMGQIIPEAIAERYQVIPFRKTGRKLLVAMIDPLDYFCIEDLRLRTGYNIEPAIISKEEFTRAFATLYGLSDSMNDLMNMETEDEEIREDDLTDEDSPVVRLVNQMLQQAVRLNASDVHVDPMEKNVVIRYRIDGFLKNERVIPKNMQGYITARLKIMANMNIAERRLPQDGSIKMRFDFKSVDIRVSTLPTLHGEKIVLRILDLTFGILQIDKLGMSENNMALFQKMLNRPNGMVLITGPTGSGKSTTLFSALSQLNNEGSNIITVEDPVEYQLEGINQVQINPTIGLTFANGLRSILRQDPNVVMVGEIRDLETTQIAIRASLTGHIVFSTLHTNNSLSTIARLKDMGVEPFLIASSIIGIVAQRLVRRICADCKTSYEADEQERIYMRRLGIEAPVLYKGTGCGACRKSGYRGRISIHEVLWVDDGLRKMIMEEASIDELRKHAIRHGMKPLFEDGLDKVSRGETTFQEVLREALDD